MRLPSGNIRAHSNQARCKSTIISTCRIIATWSVGLRAADLKRLQQTGSGQRSERQLHRHHRRRTGNGTRRPQFEKQARTKRRRDCFAGSRRT